MMAVDWLNDFGSGSRAAAEADAKLKLSHTAAALVELSQFLISTAEDNAEKSASVATGRIISSMEAGPIVTTGTKTSLAIYIDSAYKFTDKGVKGVESGKSYAGYSFKTKYANKKMATAILKWLRQRGRRGRIKYKGVSKGESKNKGINRTLKKADDLKSLAYAVAANIKKRGIKPTQFFTHAVRDTNKLAAEKLGKAVKLDIIESLKNL